VTGEFATFGGTKYTIFSYFVSPIGHKKKPISLISPFLFVKWMKKKKNFSFYLVSVSKSVGIKSNYRGERGRREI